MDEWVFISILSNLLRYQFPIHFHPTDDITLLKIKRPPQGQNSPYDLVLWSASYARLESWNKVSIQDLCGWYQTWWRVLCLHGPSHIHCKLKDKQVLVSITTFIIKPYFKEGFMIWNHVLHIQKTGFVKLFPKLRTYTKMQPKSCFMLDMSQRCSHGLLFKICIC